MGNNYTAEAKFTDDLFVDLEGVAVDLVAQIEQDREVEPHILGRLYDQVIKPLYGKYVDHNLKFDYKIEGDNVIVQALDQFTGDIISSAVSGFDLEDEDDDMENFDDSLLDLAGLTKEEAGINECTKPVKEDIEIAEDNTTDFLASCLRACVDYAEEQFKTSGGEVDWLPSINEIGRENEEEKFAMLRDFVAELLHR